MADLIEHDDIGLLRALPALQRDAARYRSIRAALLSGGPEWNKLAAMLNIAPDTAAGVDDAVDATFGVPASAAGLTLDANDTRFLAARLRRLFAHFKVAVPDGGDDARLIGNAAAGIGLLLTAQPAGVPEVPHG